MSQLIKNGDTGLDVKLLQHKLNTCGASLVEDGFFGSRTKTSVLNYQKKSGLVVDGIVGSKTWSTIMKVSN